MKCDDTQFAYTYTHAEVVCHTLNDSIDLTRYFQHPADNSSTEALQGSYDAAQGCRNQRDAGKREEGRPTNRAKGGDGCQGISSVTQIGFLALSVATWLTTCRLQGCKSPTELHTAEGVAGMQAGREKVG
mmetsp:Transcript_31584/g.62454  ORF Transcript_31584/g.62454 Transcript_31584/m.62454 type:complete len:130 (-) Transcript_31584:340-729(-)